MSLFGHIRWCIIVIWKGVGYVEVMCVFTFLPPCCDVRCDFSIERMVGSSLPSVICRPTRVGRLVSYLRYLCLFVHSGVKYILCCIYSFVCLRLVSFVPNVAGFSGLSMFNCVYGFFNVYWTHTFMHNCKLRLECWTETC